MSCQCDTQQCIFLQLFSRHNYSVTLICLNNPITATIYPVSLLCCTSCRWKRQLTFYEICLQAVSLNFKVTHCSLTITTEIHWWQTHTDWMSFTNQRYSILVNYFSCYHGYFHIFLKNQLLCELLWVILEHQKDEFRNPWLFISFNSGPIHPHIKLFTESENY